MAHIRLMKPTRRKLLGAAIAAPFVKRSALSAALAGAHGSIFPPVPSNLPADVATYFPSGKVTFYDPMTSLNTFDTGMTGLAGFNWYFFVQWPNATLTGYKTAPNADPTGVSLNSPGNGVALTKGAHFNVATACSNGGSGYNGTVFSGGGYFECSMNYDPTLALSADTIWPAFWSRSIADLETTLPNGTLYWEPDFFEASPNGNGAVSTYMAAHEWTITSPAGSTANSSAGSGTPVSLGGSPTQFHRYGCLWVPAAKNGGTGLFRRYYDGNLVTGPNPSFTYSTGAGASPAFTPSNPTGVWSGLDSAQIMLILSAGPGTGWPVNVNNVIVVQ